MNQPPRKLLLRNAAVVLPDSILDRGTILVEDGLISTIDESNAIEASRVESIDLGGTTILPGFVDFHIHGAVGVDVMAATSDGLQEVSRYLASQGVTAWVPTFVPVSDENYASAIDAISGTMQSPDNAGARVLGVHYEGPFVNSAQCGALHVEYFKTYASPADLDRLPVLAEEKVRMITLAPEVDGGVELVRELKRRGWVISIGHTRASLEVLDQAFKAGARHMTHFMNAMAPLHHRNPGPIAWGLANDDVTIDLIADGIHLDPFMLRLLLKIKSARAISLISDAIAAAGKGDGDYNIWGETISVKNGRTANASGSIAGSVISMLDAVRLMLSLGVSPLDVAQLASTNPARLLGVDHECGALEPGKRADLVALAPNGNPHLTLIAGHIAFSQS
ncbi:MAG TPA: N-acetylglucosamine-6-phosphate deacetylase [Pyrinomonadaceae bacterium]|nr:N-acetylglucosamine-6-phosphate deacetylase [Pyrinomonadaceae bacterium]